MEGMAYAIDASNSGPRVANHRSRFPALSPEISGEMVSFGGSWLHSEFVVVMTFAVVRGQEQISPTQNSKVYIPRERRF